VGGNLAGGRGVAHAATRLGLFNVKDGWSAGSAQQPVVEAVGDFVAKVVPELEVVDQRIARVVRVSGQVRAHVDAELCMNRNQCRR